MRTEEAYEEPLNAAESYQALLGSLGISYSDLLHAADAVEWTEDRIAELRDQADTQSRTNAQTRKQMEVSQARVRVIQEFLGRPENRARAQRRAELDREMEDQQKRMSDAGKRCAALEAEQRGKREQLQQRNELLRGAVIEEDDLEVFWGGSAPEPVFRIEWAPGTAGRRSVWKSPPGGSGTHTRTHGRGAPQQLSAAQ
ncbi:MAG: hypothetical protein ACLTYN_05600 [Dysosmobacter welbionis]